MPNTLAETASPSAPKSVPFTLTLLPSELVIFSVINKSFATKLASCTAREMFAFTGVPFLSFTTIFPFTVSRGL